MADPTIAGVVITPNPPTPGALVTFRIAADDADLHNPRRYLMRAQEQTTGEVLVGVLAPETEDLRYDIVPADATSPEPVQDLTDETMFAVICPAGVTKLAYLAIVQDTADHAASFPFETLPIPEPEPEPPPTGKTLLWEAVTDLDANGDFSPYTGTATGDPTGSQHVRVVDAPAESGFQGKVGEFHYANAVGQKDANASVSFRRPDSQGMTNGDTLICDLLLCVPQPDEVNSFTSSGRKLVYFQPRGNGENNFVFFITYGSGVNGLGKIQTTFNARTLPTVDKPLGMLQRMTVDGFKFGVPQRVVVKLTPSSQIDVQDGEMEMWIGDPNDWNNARYGKISNLRYITEAGRPVIDFRVGQQVNENDLSKQYNENRWYKRILLQLYR